MESIYPSLSRMDVIRVLGLALTELREHNNPIITLLTYARLLFEYYIMKFES